MPKLNRQNDLPKRGEKMSETKLFANTLPKPLIQLSPGKYGVRDNDISALSRQTRVFSQTNANFLASADLPPACDFWDNEKGRPNERPFPFLCPSK